MLEIALPEQPVARTHPLTRKLNAPAESANAQRLDEE